MVSLPQTLADKTSLGLADRQWLHALTHEWHVLADTSFSDLILWVPEKDPNVFLAVAQIRPTTGPTALTEEVVGEEIRYDPESLVTDAYLSEEICATSDNKIMAGIPVDIWAIPIMKRGVCIGIVERHTNQMGVRAPGGLEDAYLEVANTLTEMLHQGIYPVTPPLDPSVAPKVGDGLIRVAPSGIITYASPNAISCYRALSRVGDLEGEDFRQLNRSFQLEVSQVGQDIESDLEKSGVTEFELAHRAAVVRVRSWPLMGLEAGQTSPELLVLTRDISELRARERQLVSKDATIREIHHRVKNNLQTVAALLRLQTRRTHSEDAKEALSDAMGRVQAIALVHEILSQSYVEDVVFDDIADRILESTAHVAMASGAVKTSRKGSFGLIPANVATKLSLVLNELCQNAGEHGLNHGPGEICVKAKRRKTKLVVQVSDNGKGLEDGFDAKTQTSSLGLSIVCTLIDDINGEFTLTNRTDQPGAVATVMIPTSTWSF